MKPLRNRQKRRRWLVPILSAATLATLTAFAADGTAPSSSTTISLTGFLAGIAGALVVYVALYRQSRIKAIFENPGANSSILFVDLGFFLLAGGLVAAFLVQDGDLRQFFTAGASWQGIVGGMISGTERSDLQGKFDEKHQALNDALKELENWRKRIAPQQVQDVQDLPKD